jgi:hypothetical protein
METLAPVLELRRAGRQACSGRQHPRCGVEGLSRVGARMPASTITATSARDRQSGEEKPVNRGTLGRWLEQTREAGLL